MFKIEFGENPETTLIREILEETGLEIHDQTFIKTDSVVVNYTDDELGKLTLHHVGFIFKIKLKDIKSLMPKHDDEDLICTKWVDVSTIALEEISPFLQELLMDSNQY